MPFACMDITSYINVMNWFFSRMEWLIVMEGKKHQFPFGGLHHLKIQDLFDSGIYTYPYLLAPTYSLLSIVLIVWSLLMHAGLLLFEWGPHTGLTSHQLWFKSQVNLALRHVHDIMLCQAVAWHCMFLLIGGETHACNRYHAHDGV